MKIRDYNRPVQILNTTNIMKAKEFKNIISLSESRIKEIKNKLSNIHVTKNINCIIENILYIEIENKIIINNITKKSNSIVLQDEKDNTYILPILF